MARVRMCAARADLVALLSLPRHYDERRAVAYASALGTALEPQTLSYGAIWHPWLITIDEQGGALRTTPPDGATAGVMAARAAARGAWVPPANEPLRGVVSLTPAIPAAARQSLQDAAVNLIRHEPAGFLCLDSDTLSNDDDVRPLNVRRLLILVRRAALRAGNEYAFEPNGDALRNTVKRGFESLLATLFARGAFAGRNARGAYQVITDETVNTPQSVDAGRFIAELRIAPARPLSFLTIRLLQRAEASTAVEVR
jgi:phage tail sheath protein FI